MRRQGFTVWFTGLPSSGKTTLSSLLHKELDELGLAAEVLDGDEVRQRLTKGLGFTKEGRDENIRRIAYVAKLLTRVGGVAITAAISPYRELRDLARAEIGSFVEVYVNCPLQVCMQRDVKGMYAKAIKGDLPNFTGISDPYEPPLNPEVTLYTDRESPEESLKKILVKLVDLNCLPSHLISRRLKENAASCESEQDAAPRNVERWSI
nr:adenylyl-sulfate kinase [Nitrospirota bacterium]